MGGAATASPAPPNRLRTLSLPEDFPVNLASFSRLQRVFLPSLRAERLWGVNQMARIGGHKGQRPSAGWASNGCLRRFMVQPLPPAVLLVTLQSARPRGRSGAARRRKSALIPGKGGPRISAAKNSALCTPIDLMISNCK